MPDITMCKDSDCPKAETCYRFTAKPSGEWQSYFVTSPRSLGGTATQPWCKMYWPAWQGGEK